MATTPFVSIAGIDLGQALVDQAYEEPPELLGDFVRGDGGDVQTSERTPKRGFALVVTFTPTDYATFLAAVSVAGQLGVPTPVAVTSPADGLTRGDSLTCYVRCGRVQYRSTGAGTVKTVKLVVPLALKEA